MYTEILTAAGDIAPVASTLAEGASEGGEAIAAPAGPNAGGIQSWVQENVIGLVITVVGAFAMWRARTGDVSGIATIAAGALIAFGIIAMAVPGVRDTLTGWFAGFLGGS